MNVLFRSVVRGKFNAKSREMRTHLFSFNPIVIVHMITQSILSMTMIHLLSTATSLFLLRPGSFDKLSGSTSATLLIIQRVLVLTIVFVPPQMQLRDQKDHLAQKMCDIWKVLLEPCLYVYAVLTVDVVCNDDVLERKRSSQGVSHRPICVSISVQDRFV